MTTSPNRLDYGAVRENRSCLEKVLPLQVWLKPHPNYSQVHLTVDIFDT